MDTIAKKLNCRTTRKHYFYWKNHVKTIKYDFSGEMSKEDFIHIYLKDNVKEFDKFEVWSESEHYANLMKLFYNNQKEKDFMTCFEAIREKALAGDNASIKTFMLLQKIIEKSKKNQKDDEDDGLEV